VSSFVLLALPLEKGLVLIDELILVVQYNLFFLSYLFAPKMAHRFVACLEEEAVLT
jgi:hypothetical protein